MSLRMVEELVTTGLVDSVRWNRWSTYNVHMHLSIHVHIMLCIYTYMHIVFMYNYIQGVHCIYIK